MTELPPGYLIIDGEFEVHDGDEEDGRFGLYVGSNIDDPDLEFLGCLHDRDEVVRLAHEHASQQ